MQQEIDLCVLGERAFFVEFSTRSIDQPLPMCCHVSEGLMFSRRGRLGATSVDYIFTLNPQPQTLKPFGYGIWGPHGKVPQLPLPLQSVASRAQDAGIRTTSFGHGSRVA